MRSLNRVISRLANARFRGLSSQWLNVPRKFPLLAALLLLSARAYAAPLVPSNIPLTYATETSVKPNIMLVLDDSGSMGNEYTPDYVAEESTVCFNGTTVMSGCAPGDPPYMSRDFNFQYYNPATTYLPGVNADGTSMPSMTSANTAGWTRVDTDPYNRQNYAFYTSASLFNLVSGFPDGQWCRSSSSSDCRRNTAAAPYDYPTDTYASQRTNATAPPYYYLINATLYCQDFELTTCRAQAAPSGQYVYPAAVRWCDSTNTSRRNCQRRKLGSFRYAAYDRASFVRTDLLPGATFARAASRLDCAGARCTYDEEMTNFANWFSYYRTRMQMLKTASGRAFSALDERFRAGLFSINALSSNYSRISDFQGANRSAWFTRLYSTTPSGSTPLRRALSYGGRIFAGKNPFGLSTTDDPMQYSCQQNFMILTTDGYWNETNERAVVRVDGTTRVDNVDNTASAGRPRFDGNPGYCPPGATCLGNTCQGSTNNQSSYSSCNTLADVAHYYYNTDLRSAALANCTGITGEDVCQNNVNSSDKDPASHQHMTTYTLGLGVDGTMVYRDDYDSAGGGDYAEIVSGQRNWPQVRNLDATAVDDLWHAAVNGRGKYFSAKNPTELSRGLVQALFSLGTRLGAGAAAATSNIEPVAGDNFAYIASYTTQSWVGNLEGRYADLQTGVIGSQAFWCAEDVPGDPSLGTQDCSGTLKQRVEANRDTRTIYLASASSGTGLKPLLWSQLSATEKTYFDPRRLSQWSALSTTDQAATGGEQLLNYVRGQWGFENQAGNEFAVFRDRSRTLGDIVGSQPVYVKQPYFDYEDAGYEAFKRANQNRDAVVYVGSNDGMLHAFDATNGTENWAFVPTAALPTLSVIADQDYGIEHRYSVDGAPVVADVYDGRNWRSVLIGGLNAGGKSFYALDVTDPANPRLLWEFNDAGRLGLSYGNPVVTQNAAGRWVVLLTSGYNADGGSKLHVLDAVTGATVQQIAVSGNGLSRVISFASAPDTHNQTLAAYGGDLDGNVWRFDIDAGTAVLITRLTDASGRAQPITSRMEITEHEGQRILFIGTGKLLEATDLDTTQTQSVYAIADQYDTRGTFLNPRNTLIRQTLTPGTSATGKPIRSASNNPVDLVLNRGWYVDFPDRGERANLDLQLVAGTLLVGTNVPDASACSAGGYSWLNYFNFKTGSPVSASPNNAASSKAGNAFSVGISVMKLGSGFAVNVTLGNDPTPKKITDVAFNPGSNAVMGHRVSWQEVQ